MQTKKTFLFNPEPGASHGIFGGDVFKGLRSEAEPTRSEILFEAKMQKKHCFDTRTSTCATHANMQALYYNLERQITS